MDKNENIFEEGDLVFINKYDIGADFSYVGKIQVIAYGGWIAVRLPNGTSCSETLERCRHATEEERKEYFVQCLQ